MTIAKTKYTSQNIDNMSFDETLGVSMVEIIGADGVLKNPATETNITDLLFHYKLAGIDDADATYTYLGYLKKDGGWMIQRIPNAGGEVYYAAGASGWNWANRAAETYAVFNTTF